jgi:capsular polysaccharide transport system permease protein
MTQQVRTPWQVTRSVWYALFMREAVSRTTADRFAWFWMVFEPAAFIVIMISVRALLLNRTKTIYGAEFIPWLIVGLFGFFLFRENMLRSIGAIDSNKSLFSYRQVKPIDPVIVRCFLEGVLKTFVFSLFVILGYIFAIDLRPDHALKALFYWTELWLLGTSFGLVLSAISYLVPEIGKVVKMISLPLMLVSGVIMPLNFLPHSLLQWVLLNPVVHGLELLRLSFFDMYKAVPGVSESYLHLFTITVLLLGLALHIRFSQKLKAQ